MNQKELISECLKGNEKAYYELYKLLYPSLMGIGLRYNYNEDDAKAAVNKAFMRIIDKLELFDTNREIKKWASRVAINLLFDDFRKEKHKAQVVHYENESDFESEQHELNLVELEIENSDLLLMLRELPPTSARVFNLFALDGFSHREIAEALLITESTSRWHLANARKLLQAKVTQRFCLNTNKPLINE
jgi:RNA polymerase sigma-70 factor (ECF subfamily)